MAAALRLRQVRSDAILIDVSGVAPDGPWTRTVSVLTSGGTPMFPHPLSDRGETTHEPELDARIVELARQLLIARTRPGSGRRRE